MKLLLMLIVIAMTGTLMVGLSSTAVTNEQAASTETFVNLPLIMKVHPLPQPYLEYQLYNGTIVIDDQLPPVMANGFGDYSAIFSKHNLCNLITSGDVDEIWIWAGSGDGLTKPHLWEWTTSGPGWSGYTPDCGKVVTTMTFNYLREVDVALESYNHRLEGFFSRYFPCDFSTATWPWAGSTTWPFNQCGNLLSNRFGFVARPFDGNGYVGGCGDAHHPPNILSNQDYLFSDTTIHKTICPSWSQDGSATPTSLNCQAWGCTHWGFHLWWMQNIPGMSNFNKDRSGAPHANWWSYIFGIPSGQPEAANKLMPIQAPPALKSHGDYATYTDPHDIDTVSGMSGILSAKALTSQNAVTEHNVYVIYYPGYGDTPRADISVLTTELIGVLKEATIYHGYKYQSLRGTFFGQDGASYAGVGCNVGSVPDNIHIRVEGLRTDTQISSFVVEDPVGGGVWSNPCDPSSNWLLYVIYLSANRADLYFKPFRFAPDGTTYAIRVTYSDGTNQNISVVGTSVRP